MNIKVKMQGSEETTFVDSANLVTELLSTNISTIYIPENFKELYSELAKGSRSVKTKFGIILKDYENAFNTVSQFESVYETKGLPKIKIELDSTLNLKSRGKNDILSEAKLTYLLGENPESSTVESYKNAVANGEEYLASMRSLVAEGKMRNVSFGFYISNKDNDTGKFPSWGTPKDSESGEDVFTPKSN